MENECWCSMQIVFPDLDGKELNKQQQKKNAKVHEEPLES